MFSSSHSVAVIGLGTYGVSLCRALKNKGARVLGVDFSQDLVDRYHAEFDSTICADATDLKALRECAIDDQDTVIIAIGSDTKASLLSAYNVIKLGAKSVRAKAQSDAHADILKAIGVKTIDRPEVDAGQAVAKELTDQVQS